METANEWENTQKTDSILKKKIEIPATASNVIALIIYLPIAFVIFSLSVMAFDDPYAPAWQSWLAFLFINGIPLLLLIASLTSSKKQEKETLAKKKFSFRRVLFWIVFIIFITPVLGMILSSLIAPSGR